MKRFIITFIGICFAFCCNAQNNDSRELASTKDSLLINLYKADSLNTAISVVESMVNRYELYSTKNQNVHLRLDTATGEIYMVYYEIGGEWTKKLIKVCDPLYYPEIYDRLVSGRFKLYPTTNMYNYILLDTVYGTCWNVQWSYEESERFRGYKIY